jgi:predicted NAD-dependent protein-ADP-ribosyltransferase YbiA (DUF1768 family)
MIRDFVHLCRESFTRIGLRLRLNTDREFSRVLLTTGQSMLVVCDARDTFMGIGLDELAFKAWRSQKVCACASTKPNTPIRRSLLARYCIGYRRRVRVRT